MSMRNYMLAECERLKAKAIRLEQEITKAPEGTFYAVRDGKYVKWYSYKEGKRVTIKKSDKQMAAALAVKKFRQFQLDNIRKELHAIQIYLDNDHSMNEEEFLDTHPDFRALISNRQLLSQRVREWAEANYEKSPMNGKYKYRTLKGDMVKSLAEKQIADALFIRGIPYRYECAIYLQNGNKTVYPDFMIMDPETGLLYIWEHFGMSEINYYQAKNADKMYLYFNNGYIPGRNLICTASDDQFKLSKSKIEAIIDLHFSAF